MRVTSVGQIPSERIWVGKCNKCNSEAEALEKELTHITYDQRDGSFSWEKCPVCGSGEVNGYGGMCFHIKKVVESTPSSI